MSTTTSDTLLREGKRVRRCCGRNDNCLREAVLPENDPYLCRQCDAVHREDLENAEG